MRQGDSASHTERANGTGWARHRPTSETLAILGVGIALAALMLTGYAGLRADLRALQGDMNTLGRDLRGEMSVLASELRGEMQALASELRGEMQVLASELRGEMSVLGRDLRSELGAVRDDVAGLREEVGDLRRDVATLREEVEEIQADSAARTGTFPALSLSGAGVGPTSGRTASTVTLWKSVDS